MNRIATVAALLVALILGMAAGPQGAAASTTIRTSSASATTAAIRSPESLDLFVGSGFMYQDPNMYACTATSAVDILNFIALGGTGGSGFRWTPTRSASTRDWILNWEHTHDTLAGGNGSDPHGVRNAINQFGWGKIALTAPYRVYDDIAFYTFDGAMKRTVRAMIETRKPVAILAWAGRHMQMVVGYYGLSGDPFAKDSLGHYTNAFTVAGFYLVDPLKSQTFVNRPIDYASLRDTPNLKFRYRPYLETDSPYDDPYTPGVLPARNEWYGRFVIVAPIR
jgi:hypothetical protein